MISDEQRSSDLQLQQRQQGTVSKVEYVDRGCIVVIKSTRRSDGGYKLLSGRLEGYFIRYTKGGSRNAKL